MLTGQGNGVRFPNFLGRVARNDATLRAAHAAQIGLLGALRADPGQDRRIRLMQTMNCISAGLGWTG
jgi:phosphoenolpyruvate carboxylase